MSGDNPNKYFTAAEVATIAREVVAKGEDVPRVPTTESGIIRWIKRQDDEDIMMFSRPRRGQKGGGGTEYNWAFFPESLWPALCAELDRRDALMPYNPHLDAYERKRVHQRKYKRLAKLPPDLSARGRLDAEMLARAAGLDASTVTFSDFVIRKVDRCRVRLNNRKYFSLDLTEYHQSEVCVTMTDAAPNLLWVLEFERSRYHRSAPGRLICIADARAGIARYVSEEFQQAAEAKREAGRIRRLALAKQDAAFLENYSNMSPEAGISPLGSNLNNLKVRDT